jgi:hypothetical protein
MHGTKWRAISFQIEPDFIEIFRRDSYMQRRQIRRSILLDFGPLSRERACAKRHLIP